MAAKKSNVLLWVLGGIAVLIFLVIASVGIGGYVIYSRVKSAGVDQELMKKNPALAMAKLATAMNPDVEVVSTDENAGEIVVREKSTGKEVRMRFDRERQTLVVIDDQGKETKVKVDRGVEVATQEGRTSIGAGTRPPAWVPAYPGSAPDGAVNQDERGEIKSVFSYSANADAKKVTQYYRDTLSAEGYREEKTDSGVSPGEYLMMRNDSKDRSVAVTAFGTGGGSRVVVTATEGHAARR